jgi:hypothetical protein
MTATVLISSMLLRAEGFGMPHVENDRIVESKKTNICRTAITLANTMGSLNQFVLVKARKSRGGEWWSTDDYDVRDNAGKVVGRIMLHPQALKDLPWFWTITAREIPPSVHNRGYSATRARAMSDFKARWAATTV